MYKVNLKFFWHLALFAGALGHNFLHISAFMCGMRLHLVFIYQVVKKDIFIQGLKLLDIIIYFTFYHHFNYWSLLILFF